MMLGSLAAKKRSPISLKHRTQHMGRLFSGAPASIAEKFNGSEANGNNTAFNASYSLYGPHKAHGFCNVMRVDHLTRQNYPARFYL
jgi:hypothetical protein